MVTKKELAEYLKIHSDDVDASLTWCLNAAKSKAKTAGIPDFKKNAQYDYFILSLAGYYYDQRSLLPASRPTNAERDDALVQKMINSFVLELRYAEDG